MNNEKSFIDFDEMMEELENLKNETSLRKISIGDVSFLMKNNEPLVRLETGGNPEYIPMRNCAWNSLLQRLGIKGPAFAYNSYLDLSTKLAFFNEAIIEMTRKIDPKIQIIVQKDGVNAFMSERYSLIPISDILTAFFNKLAMIYQKLEFGFFGTWSWQTSCADFEVTVKQLDGKNYFLHLTLDSSDIGESAVRIGAYLLDERGRRIPFMNDFNIIHTGSASMEMVENHLEGLEQAVDEKVRRVESLINLPIVPSEAKLNSLFKKVGLPVTKINQEIDFSDCDTAWDVFTALSVICKNDDRDKEIRMQSDLMKLFNVGYWKDLRK